MDYYLAISYQLPDLAHYRYCYLMMLLDAYIMLLWLAMFMIHKMHDDYYWASIYEIHKTHATYY